MTPTVDMQTHEGRLVRNLLSDDPETIIVDGPVRSVCPQHPSLDKRLTKIATAMTFMSDWIGEIKALQRDAAKVNGRQSEHIAILKSEAKRNGALWGAIIAGVVSIAANIAVKVVFK